MYDLRESYTGLEFLANFGLLYSGIFMPGYKSVSQKLRPVPYLYLSSSDLRITFSLSEDAESDSESELDEVSEFFETAEPKANQPSNKIRKQKQLSSYVTFNNLFTCTKV